MEHNTASKKILVIEDNRDLANLLELHLRDLTYEVELAFDGTAGLSRALEGRYDLIILDITLPGTDGLEILRRLRSRPLYIPILMLTSRSSELDRVLGLEMGADDYVSKPFSIRELMARVKAIFRRVEGMRSETAAPESQVIRAGELTLDPEKRKVTLGDRPVELTAKEYELLLHFSRNPGKVFNRAQLLDSVWGYGHDGYEHTVNSHINRLRAKIEEDPARPRYILTVWGVGYKFAEPDEI